MIRVGMIGTGRIAARFVDELRCVVQDGQIKLTCVYNPHPGSAAHFASQHGIERYTDQLDEFLSLVDAVYIATPHETHVPYAQKMLASGKHVLCEKPLALREMDAADLFVLAKEKNLVCMEAIKTAYCPGFLALQKLIEQGVIGRVHDVEACFTKIGAAAGRESWGDYAGSFLELGSYCLLPVVRLLGVETKQAHTWSLKSVTGCDSYTKLLFEHETQCATVKTGLGVKSDGELMIAGEKGYIHVPSPWWLTKKIEVRHENPNQVEVYEYPFEGGGLRYEIAAFIEHIRMKKQQAEQEDEKPDHQQSNSNLTEEESIWMARQMEQFLLQRKCDYNSERVKEQKEVTAEKQQNKPKIWAHRGCSMQYPENTLLAFEKAAQVTGLTGIELDVQLTQDGQLVVIHDERLDRTTTGSGYVKDYTLSQIKALSITPSGEDEPYVHHGTYLQISTLAEVFDLLKPYCVKTGLQINIELKNSVLPYEGMEEKVLAMVDAYELADFVIYSSFNHASMGRIKQLFPEVRTGLLSGDILQAMEHLQMYQADALHPCNTGMAINYETVQQLLESKIPIRVWNGYEPLFGQKKPLGNCDLEKYMLLGATDFITNVPERYLQ